MLYAKSNLNINEESIKKELEDIYINLQAFFVDLTNEDLTDETLAVINALQDIDRLIEAVGYQQDQIVNLITNDIETTVLTIREQISNLIS